MICWPSFRATSVGRWRTWRSGSATALIRWGGTRHSAVVEWRDSATLADGTRYVNDGVHVVRIRWGRVVSLHAYLDTEVFANACRTMAAAGISEASSVPIED